MIRWQLPGKTLSEKDFIKMVGDAFHFKPGIQQDFAFLNSKSFHLDERDIAKLKDLEKGRFIQKPIPLDQSVEKISEVHGIATSVLWAQINNHQQLKKNGETVNLANSTVSTASKNSTKGKKGKRNQRTDL